MYIEEREKATRYAIFVDMRAPAGCRANGLHHARDASHFGIIGSIDVGEKFFVRGRAILVYPFADLSRLSRILFKTVRTLFL